MTDAVAEEIKKGDIVWLKSGGPAMTVENTGTYTNGPGALCVWFINDERKNAVFGVETLSKTKPAQS